MKKTTKLLTVFCLCSFLALSSSEKVYAQNDDRATTATADDDDDDDNNWGWIGLVGLAGLLGLRGKDRDDRDRDVNVRTTNPPRV